MTNSSLKKILCAMLAVMMFLSIASYGTVAAAEDTYPMGETSGYVLDYGKYSDVDWSTKPSFKIGFSWMSSADLLWSMYERSVRYACDVLHCELIFVEWDTSSTTFVSDAIENLCQAGVDGIVSGMMDGASIDACIRANVPFVGSLNQMNDEMLKTANESGLFCGNVIDDDYVSTYNSVKALYDAGCRKIAWVAPQPGTTQAEIRSSGIMDALKDYPELEGLVVSNGLDVTSIWYNTGAADRGVKLAVTDLCESYQDLFQDDLIAYCATDQFPSLVIATTLLYNKLTGHEIMADTSVQMRRHFLELHNYEEMCNMWNMSFLNIFPMTAEQVLDLCVEFNPDADEALYLKYAEEYTIENVAATNAHLLEACPVKDRLG